MLLCDDTIWSIPDGASGIEFANPDEGRYFIEMFNQEWDVAVEAVAKEHEDCLRDNPASVVEKEGRFTVSFVPLDIPYMDGEYCDTNEGCEALTRALNKLKNEYPNAQYSGCIQFAWSDSRGGDVVKYDVSSNPADAPYPLVGQVLKEAVEDEDEYFWEQIEDLDEVDEVAEDLKNYKDWVGEEAIERISEYQE